MRKIKKKKDPGPTYERMSSIGSHEASVVGFHIRVGNAILWQRLSKIK